MGLCAEGKEQICAFSIAEVGLLLCFRADCDGRGSCGWKSEEITWPSGRRNPDSSPVLHFMLHVLTHFTLQAHCKQTNKNEYIQEPGPQLHSAALLPHSKTLISRHCAVSDCLMTLYRLQRDPQERQGVQIRAQL